MKQLRFVNVNVVIDINDLFISPSGLYILIDDMTYSEAINIFNDVDYISNIEYIKDEDVVATYYSYKELSSVYKGYNNTGEECLTVQLTEYNNKEAIEKIAEKQQEIQNTISKVTQNIPTIQNELKKLTPIVDDITTKVTDINSIVNHTYDFDNMSLAEIQDYRHGDNKKLLKKFLSDSFVSFSGYDYGVTEEDQEEMSLQLMSYQIDVTVNPNAILEWHSIKKQCKPFTLEDFTTLLLKIKAFVYPYMNYMQSLKERIYSSTSKTDVLKLVADYDNYNITSVN